MGICTGRVAIVTGAGRGIGREHALLLAREGAHVVVNDVGAARDGTGGDQSLAQLVVSEIEAAGGVAVANTDSVSSWEGAQRIVDTAVQTFGELHAVVNNAGIIRDRLLFNMSEEEWDAVIDVHLKGTFAMSRWAAAHWRERSKAGATVDARIVNTTSISGLYGNPGQSNYGAAKAGIAMLTNIAALELGRYGITANAIAPSALTRMTEGILEEDQDQVSPRWIAPIVGWLVSEQSLGVSGRVFEVSGDLLAVAEGWHRGPRTAPVEDPGRIDEVVRRLLADAHPNAGLDGEYGTSPQPGR